MFSALFPLYFSYVRNRKKKYNCPQKFSYVPPKTFGNQILFCYLIARSYPFSLVRRKKKIIGVAYNKSYKLGRLSGLQNKPSDLPVLKFSDMICFGLLIIKFY